MKQVKVVALAFYTGRRVKPGTLLYVPEKLNRKWFIEVKKAAPAVPTAAEASKTVDDDISDLI